MLRYTVLTLISLLAGLGVGRLQAQDRKGDDLAAKLAKLEYSVTLLKFRLIKTERLVVGVQKKLGPSTELAAIADETTQLKNVMQCLIASGKRFPRLADGTIDAYAIVRLGVVEADTAESLMQSARTCRGPTVEEIKKGDYARFPYHRAGRWCTADSKRVAPVLWEKEADRNGKVVVAFNTGAVKYMERKEIERLIAELEK